jgi:hypothetical protein
VPRDCVSGAQGGEGAGDILRASHREAPCVIHSAVAGVHAFHAHARGEHIVDANATLPMCHIGPIDTVSTASEY